MEKPIVFNITEEENNLIHYYHLLTETYKNVLIDIISNRRCINANKELLNYNKESMNWDEFRNHKFVIECLEHLKHLREEN